MKRSSPLKRTTALARNVGLKATGGVRLLEPKLTARPRLRRSEAERSQRQRWNALVPHGVEGHHAIRRQVIERLAASAGLDVVEWAWDPRWMIPLSRAVHAAHTNRSKRLSIDVVPLAAWGAAKDLDEALERAGRPRTALIELRREYGLG